MVEATPRGWSGDRIFPAGAYGEDKPIHDALVAACEKLLDDYAVPLTTAPPMHKWSECRHCGEEWIVVEDGTEERHRPGCVVLQARAAIKLAKAEE